MSTWDDGYGCDIHALVSLVSCLLKQNPGKQVKRVACLVLAAITGVEIHKKPVLHCVLRGVKSCKKNILVSGQPLYLKRILTDTKQWKKGKIHVNDFSLKDDYVE